MKKLGRRSWQVKSVIAVLGLLSALLFTPSIANAQAMKFLSGAAAESQVSRLSDAQVRELLLQRLQEKDAVSNTEEESFNPAMFAYRLQRDMGALAEELDGIFKSVSELHMVFPRAWRQFSADREEGGLVWFFAALAISMGLAGVVEFLAWRKVWSTPIFAKDHVSASVAMSQGLRTKAARLGLMFLVRIALLAIFLAVATAIFLLFFDEGSKDRIAFFFYLSAVGIFRLVHGMSRAFYAPRFPSLRLPSFSDADAVILHRTSMITVGFGAFGYFTCALFGTLGVNGEVHELFLILVGSSTIVLWIYSTLSGRRAISADITAVGSEAGKTRTVFAEMWPWIFAIVLVVLWVFLVLTELLRDFVPYGAALFTIAMLAVLPSFDALLQRETVRQQDADETVNSAIARGSRLILLLFALISLSAAWRINPFAMSGDGIGAKASGAALQITLTLLIAYVIWQTVQIFIDRRIAEEDAEAAEKGADLGEMEIGGEGLSRMRTLLPLLRKTVQITLGVIVIMITLAELGVEIGPILAGAGVIGLAIGFGSQALIRDIVSGAFFLIDDAFRLGEYIDVGEVKGSVEKMSVRSLRLRHHRGAVHTVPFGEVKTLTNYSRDWAIMKLKFRVKFDADVRKVKKIFKKIGQELLEHEEIGEDFIQPFKSQGVLEVDDYGLIVRAKFMCKPGKQFMIRKEAYIMVQNAFAENGIEFARPEVKVVVDDEDDVPVNKATVKAAGAAAHTATQQTKEVAAE